MIQTETESYQKSDRLLYTILLSQGGPLSYIYIATFFLSADLFSKLFHLPWNCFYLTLLSSLQCLQVLLTKKMILHPRFSWQRPHFWPHYQKYDLTWMLVRHSNILPNECHLMVCYGPRALCNVNVSLQALKGNIDENLTNSSAIWLEFYPEMVEQSVCLCLKLI